MQSRQSVAPQRDPQDDVIRTVQMSPFLRPERDRGDQPLLRLRARGNPTTRVAAAGQPSAGNASVTNATPAVGIAAIVGAADGSTPASNPAAARAGQASTTPSNTSPSTRQSLAIDCQFADCGVEPQISPSAGDDVASTTASTNCADSRGGCVEHGAGRARSRPS